MKQATREYMNKNVDLNGVALVSEHFFSEEGFKTQIVKDTGGYLVQATKGGVYRTILAPDRAFTVLIDGEPNRFEVRVGVAEWSQNPSGDLVKSFLLTPCVSFKEIPEALWAFETEHNFWHNLETQITLGIQ